MGFPVLRFDRLVALRSCFCRAAGDQLGFNDLKVIEAAHFLRCIAGLEQPFIGFEQGVVIEKTIHGMAASAAAGVWIDIGG
jgi:predicted dehydrogenase